MTHRAGQLCDHVLVYKSNLDGLEECQLLVGAVLRLSLFRRRHDVFFNQLSVNIYNGVFRDTSAHQD